MVGALEEGVTIQKHLYKVEKRTDGKVDINQQQQSPTPEAPNLTYKYRLETS